VVRQYLELSGQEHQPIVGLRVGDIFDRYKAGDPHAAQVINRASKYLGLALSYLVNFLNPELIILGDDLVGGEDIFLPRIRSEIEANSLPDFVENLEIRVSRLGHDIGLKGAASFAFRNSLNNAAVLQKMCRPAVESHEPIEAQDVASPHSTSSRSGSALV
jgi:predicted NBD/HSP70 family sugar kinase